jgi:hypothetical protein
MKSGAQYNPAVKVASVDTSGSSQQADHGCETPWAWHSNAVVCKCASWP